MNDFSPVSTKALATVHQLAPCPKAYSYVRFSTKRQGQGDRLQRKLDRSRQYAAEHDLDVSAFDRSNVTKGALAAFIQAAESGVIERGFYLLVESIDRLSRSDQVDGISLLDRLVKLGIRIVKLIDR
jgi:DNA invertase Pin-like site-specific DNA recombinase